MNLDTLVVEIETSLPLVKGDTYTLTEDDKQDIANLVIEAGFATEDYVTSAINSAIDDSWEGEY